MTRSQFRLGWLIVAVAVAAVGLAAVVCRPYQVLGYSSLALVIASAVITVLLASGTTAVAVGFIAWLASAVGMSVVRGMRFVDRVLRPLRERDSGERAR
jgi:hypothetical protein